jgi:hypothetical protein
MTLGGVVGELFADPRRALIDRWNWKAALFSATLRATLFLCANLTAGWKAATTAMLAEFIYRACSSGFYGAITQALSKVEPAWTAAIASAVFLPGASHSIEFVVHLLLGTPNLRTSLIASVSFTVLSTLFNLYAMRRGALLVGAEGGSVGADLRRMPWLIAGFLAAGPIALFRLVGWRIADG